MVFQALQFLSKAHRCKVQTGGWEKEPALFKEVIKKAINMGEGESTTKLSAQKALCLIPGNVYV